MERKLGKIITVTSTKGGVGKTILSLNLAASYSLMDKKVLVIDLDLFGGNVATYVNSKNDKTIYNLVDDLINNRYKNISDYLYKYNDNISILASPKDPRQANKIESKYINIILNTVASRFDVIILDTNHVFNDTNIIAMDSSDSILYLFTNDLFDIKNTKSFVSIVKDVDLSNVYMVLNESIDNTRNYFSDYDIRTIIKKNIDYKVSSSMHVKEIDKYIMSGEIVLLNKNLSLTNKKGYDKFLALARDLIKDKKEG